MTVSPEQIERNWRAVRARIAAAAARAGRDPAAVTLVAVTKTVGPDEVRALYRVGQRDFGENRVQPGAAQAQTLGETDARWHLIGHLQRNKVKPALETFGLIHSLDSERLALEIAKRAAERSERREALLEINVSGEASKSGVSPDAAPALVDALARLDALRITGLMTMAPFGLDAAGVRPIFRRLRELRDALRERHPAVRLLSMGMSQDFETAVEEGADLVRVGTALFAGTA